MLHYEKPKRLWITWENQRRSIELAELLGCELFVIEETGLLRYVRATIRTLGKILNDRPGIVFVQNPSIVLALVACLYGVVSGIPVVVDRHSNFPAFSKLALWQRNGVAALSKRVFSMFSDFTLRHARITIVTNSFVAGLVEEAGGRPHVLPDPIPSIKARNVPRLDGKRNVLVVGSFADDEPIREVLGAASSLEKEGVVVYFSGNLKRASVDWTAIAPPNVRFTGFLPREDYNDVLAAVDAIVVLSTVEHCLLCGCYEAVSLEKPLVTSATQALKTYFFGAGFAEPNAESIGFVLRQVLDHPDEYAERSRLMKVRLTEDWKASFSRLEEKLCHMTDLSRT